MGDALTLLLGDEEWTTGAHLIEPLGTRTDLDVRRGPGALASLPPASAVLWVESGRPWLPEPGALEGKPSAAWLIDTHRGQGWRGRLAAAFDVVFVAQRAAVAPIGHASGRRTLWLPLAVDDAACARGADLADRAWDVAFVGAAPAGSFRHALLAELETHVAVAPWRDYLPPQEMMERYRSARVVINVPVADDLNMRVFEASGARARLVTGPMDALDDILPQGCAEVVIGRDVQSWVDAVRRMLADPYLQEGADRAYEAVTRGHTYAQRAVTVLEVLGQTVPSTSAGERARAFAAAYARWGKPARAGALPLPLAQRARWAGSAAAWATVSAVKRRLPPGWLAATRF